jgi:hypothetical protein
MILDANQVLLVTAWTCYTLMLQRPLNWMKDMGMMKMKKRTKCSKRRTTLTLLTPLLESH